jgi:hypothetical protein
VTELTAVRHYDAHADRFVLEPYVPDRHTVREGAAV